MAGIFLIQNDGELVEMVEKQYDSEALLQELLAKHPNLLAGDQINSDVPRRWLPIGREVALACEEDGGDRWAVDHLFLDQDSIPTIAEVKRSSDTRIGREVVGQMLDYAANAVVYWPIDKIRAQFRANYSTDEQADQAIAALLDNPESSLEEFWQRAEKNLQDGKVRLLFVADKIPTELQRIVEFLNEQMAPAEVLAIEIRQFARESLQTLIPRVIGQTAKAQLRKGSGTFRGEQWDEPSFLEALAADPKAGPDAVEVAKGILEWAARQGLAVSWGRGPKIGGFYVSPDRNRTGQWMISVWTYGRANIEFSKMQKLPPFDDRSKLLELLERFKRIPFLSIPEGDNTIDGYPGVSLLSLKDQSVFRQFLDIFDWAIGEIKRGVNSDQG